jgi:hypothetical protein
MSIVTVDDPDVPVPLTCPELAAAIDAFTEFHRSWAAGTSAWAATDDAAAVAAETAFDARLQPLTLRARPSASMGTIARTVRDTLHSSGWLAKA